MSAEILASSTAAAGAVLSATGVSIFVVEKARRRSLRSSTLATRWKTWTVLASLWLLALTAPIVMLIVLAGLGVLMGRELTRLLGARGIDRVVIVAGPVLALGAISLGTTIESSLIQLALGSTLIPLLGQDIDRGPARIGRMFTGIFLVTLPVAALWEIGQSSGPALVALLFGVALSDVTAYTVGSTLGRRKLSPLVSPNKTWEGAIGNLVGATAGVSIAVAALSLSWSWIPVLAPVIAVASLWGDLVVSLLKRSASVKDSGTLLPGFGGILDRVDSLVVAAPLVYLVLPFLEAAS